MRWCSVDTTMAMAVVVFVVTDRQDRGMRRGSNYPRDQSELRTKPGNLMAGRGGGVGRLRDELQAGPLYFGGVTFSRANQHPAFSFTNRVRRPAAQQVRVPRTKRPAAALLLLEITDSSVAACLQCLGVQARANHIRAARVRSSLPRLVIKTSTRSYPTKGKSSSQDPPTPTSCVRLSSQTHYAPPCGYDRHHPTCGGIRQTHITAGGTDGAVDDCRVSYIIKRRGRASAATTDFEPQVEQWEL